MRAKHAALVQALTGRFDDHQAELARMPLAEEGIGLGGGGGTTAAMPEGQPVQVTSTTVTVVEASSIT